MESAAGRKPGSMPITVFGPKEERAVFERYVEMGVERLVLNIAPMSADETLPILDEWAKLIEKIN
jgi:hypothetical protein